MVDGNKREWKTGYGFQMQKNNIHFLVWMIFKCPCANM